MQYPSLHIEHFVVLEHCLQFTSHPIHAAPLLSNQYDPTHDFKLSIVHQRVPSNGQRWHYARESMQYPLLHYVHSIPNILFYTVCVDILHFLQFIVQLTHILFTNTYQSLHDVHIVGDEHYTHADGQGIHPQLLTSTRCDLYVDVQSRVESLVMYGHRHRALLVMHMHRQLGNEHSCPAIEDISERVTITVMEYMRSYYYYIIHQSSTLFIYYYCHIFNSSFLSFI